MIYANNNFSNSAHRAVLMGVAAGALVNQALCSKPCGFTAHFMNRPRTRNFSTF